MSHLHFKPRHALEPPARAASPGRSHRPAARTAMRGSTDAKKQNLGFEPSARLHQVAYKHSKAVKNREHLPSRCDDSDKTGESTPDGLFGKHARFSLARRQINCSTSRLIRGLPGPRRTFEPSNLRATSLRYQARMVSGRATVASSAGTRRPRR
jgi:hypothetical protein